MGDRKWELVVYGYLCSGELWEHELGFHPTSSPIIPEHPTHHIIGFENLKVIGIFEQVQ
jgi:hypothetical protein